MERATVVFDGDCGFCRWVALRLSSWDGHRRLRFIALGDPNAERLLARMTPHARSASWHLVEPDGTVRSAGDAIAPISDRLPAGSAPAAIVRTFPRATRSADRALARNRSLLGRLLRAEKCDVPVGR